MTLPWGLGVADGGRRGWGVLALEQGGLQAGKAQAGPEICFSDAVEPAAEAASQRTRLGHKGRDHSVPTHGLEGRQPGLRALPQSLGLRTVKQVRLVEAPFSFLASSEGSQSGLIGTDVRLLQPGQARVDAAGALREGDLDGHQAPSAAAVPAVPRASLPGSLAMAGKAQPLEVVEEQPAGKGPPGLVHQGPAGRTTVQGGRVAPESAAAASGRTADQQDLAWAPAQREARGPWEPRLRGLVCAQPPAQVPAQEAAHAGRPWGRIFELLWLLGVRGQADVKRKRLRQPLASGYRLARVALAPRGPPGSGSCAH